MNLLAPSSLLAASQPQLADPAWLLLLLAVPLLLWRHHRHATRDRLPALTYSRLPAGSGGAWRLHLPIYCRLLALALLIIALARPQLGQTWEEITTEGIDIQIALDVSGSMAAEDFQPRNRLAVAKDVVKQFVASRTASGRGPSTTAADPGSRTPRFAPDSRRDRVGLVIFAGSAVTRSPLTTDGPALQRMVDGVQLETLPDGTAIGVALATAAARLRTSDATSRVVVLVTDGANNGGEIDPRSAASLCRGLGLKVYTVGVGTDGQVPVPRTYVDPRTGQRQVERVYTRMEVDEELLQHIADHTGGRFFLASDPDALRRIFAEIDRLETTERTVREHVEYREIFPPFALTGLALLLLPLLASAVGWTVEP